ncbi:MAG: hypothetical protein WCP55_20000 [Lentisphaerota bacterium]
MYVRLAFAVAAHLEPEILIIDEVLAVGDAEFQKKCLGKMEDVSKEGRTVIFVSHNMLAITNLCSHAFLLNQGQLIYKGNTEKVVEQYFASNNMSTGEIVWPDKDKAPGNDVVRLHSVGIYQEDFDRPTADVDISKNVIVKIKYWNLIENTCLYSCIWLKTTAGTV